MPEDSDILTLVITSPFFWGLLLGLLFAAFTWRTGLIKRKTLRDEIKQLKSELDASRQHLDRQLKVNAKGLESMDNEMKELREQNLNLKETLAAYKQKPAGQERRALLVYDRAIRSLSENAPGFASAWESAQRDAESSVDQNEAGMMKLVRRLVGTSPSETVAPFSTKSDTASDETASDKT